MDIQLIIVGIVILCAIVYTVTVFGRKAKAVAGPSCSDDCGCSSKSKTAKTAH